MQTLACLGIISGVTSPHSPISEKESHTKQEKEDSFPYIQGMHKQIVLEADAYILEWWIQQKFLNKRNSRLLHELIRTTYADFQKSTKHELDSHVFFT